VENEEGFVMSLKLCGKKGFWGVENGEGFVMWQKGWIALLTKARKGARAVRVNCFSEHGEGE
jgi:hypothetical protein